jgi:AmiR/NasT family two-component response regulator
MSMRILVAEDEALIRLDLVEMLSEAGYEIVAQASNGAEAIELVEMHKPDLAIMDINMPIMDGLTAAEKIVNSTPVLMLTAFSQRDLVMKASEIGVMGYVVKPFTINDLIPAMEVATSRFRVMSELTKEIADLSQKLEVRKLVDKAKGILMKALNLSEAEAFSWIQKTAMDRRLTMKEVAEAVISPDAAPGR